MRRSAAPGRARGCASAASARRSAPRRPWPGRRSAWSPGWRGDRLEALARRRPRCRSRPPRSPRSCAVDVDGDHVAALLRERHGERQADVAQSDDADGGHPGRQCSGPERRGRRPAGARRPEPAAASARRSARTMRSTSSRRRPCGSQPSRSRALPGRPRSECSPRPDQRGIHPQVALGVEVHAGERRPRQLGHGVRHAAGEHVVVGAILLEHQPGAAHDVARRTTSRAPPPARPASAPPAARARSPRPRRG